MKYERYPDELAHYGVKGMKWGVRKQYRSLRKDYRKSVRKAKKATDKNVNYFMKSLNNKGVLTEEESSEWKKASKNMTEAWNNARLKAQKVDKFASKNNIKVESGKTAVYDLLKKDREYNSVSYYAHRYATQQQNEESKRMLAAVGGITLASIAIGTAAEMIRYRV